MQVRKFEAPSLDEALYLVKSELGPDALILSTRPKKTKWFNKQTIEVTAAYEPPKEKAQTLEQVFDESSLSEIFPHRRGTPKEAESENDGPSVAQPVARKRPATARYIDIPGARSKKPEMTRLEQRFTALGLSMELGQDLAKQLHYDYPTKDLTLGPLLEKAMARSLSQKITCGNPRLLFAPGEWVPIGLSGTGKTTLLVKLALLARSKSKGVALVSLDSSRLMAREALAGYANLIRLPFYADKNVTRSRETLKFVDCPSIPLGSGDEDWDSFERAISGKRSFLVLDATMRVKEAQRLLEQVSRFSPAGIFLTKVDLALQLGPVFEVMRGAGLPLLGVSLSQSFKVPVRFPDEREFGMLIVRQGVFE
ncbi:MAG: hypothetical protein HYR96_04545 [Deltaproteobacteria bacterium]|nr:hypothetical protein [Deltaproteobacteria bacterium]MBI3295011.1 hypothetical protein [Deltaproteobacteria bacterium]